MLHFFWGSLRAVYWTLVNWTAGLTPEEYYAAEGNAWSDAGCYRRAIKYYRKYLEEEENAFVRAAMAWCYSGLGMLDSAARHYRQAQQAMPSLWIAVSLAALELELGNLTACRSLMDSVRDADPTELAPMADFIGEIRKRMATVEQAKSPDLSSPSS